MTGETCSKCNVAHFNYSLSGCTPCECGSGSLNSSCDNDGQCQCAVSNASTPVFQLICLCFVCRKVYLV